MAFTAEDMQISEILKDTEFLIPRNQRRYVWQKKHWQDLLSDIINIAETHGSENKTSHFIGSIARFKKK